MNRASLVPFLFPMLASLATAACDKPSDSPAVVDASATTAPQPAPTTTGAPAASAPAAVAGSDAMTAAPTTDAIPTSKGDATITPLKHATFLVGWQGKHIYFDPQHEAALDGLPKADVVFLTDIHPDHMDPDALQKVLQPSTIIVAPQAVADQLPKTIKGVTVLKNGETKTISGIPVEGIPMYNLTRGPTPGKLFHDKGRGDGFVLTLGDKRFYVSGDTECTPEMKALKNIDVAFVCMNLPYTMPPSEAAACVKAFRPKVLYPYHYRGSDLGELQKALAGESGIEVRQRNWY